MVVDGTQHAESIDINECSLTKICSQLTDLDPELDEKMVCDGTCGTSGVTLSLLLPPDYSKNIDIINELIGGADTEQASTTKANDF